MVETIDPDTLEDADLLEAFQVSRLTETECLAAAIARRRPTGWQDVALRVWTRFFGFVRRKASNVPFWVSSGISAGDAS